MVLEVTPVVEWTSLTNGRGSVKMKLKINFKM